MFYDFINTSFSIKITQIYYDFLFQTVLKVLD